MMFGSTSASTTDYSALLVQPSKDSIFLEHHAPSGPDGEALSAFMRQAAFQLGADGFMLARNEQRGGASSILYASGLCASDEEVKAHLFGETLVDSFSGRVSQKSCGTAAYWSKLILDSGQCSILSLPVLTGNNSSFCVWAVFRSIDDTRRRNLDALGQTLAPLLSGFLRLWSENSSLHHRTGGLESALNQSDVGIVLLDNKREVIFTNCVADQLLKSGNGLRRIGSSITAAELGDALRLQVAIDFSMTDRNAHVCRNAPVVAIRRGEDLRPLMVSVLAPNRSAVDDQDVAVILYVFDPNEDVSHLLEPVCKLYRLSPVEGKLACLLANGASVCEAAKEMRVKEQTARTYLKQVFLKTDTNRQAELVRLMLCSIVRTVHGAKLQVI